MLEARQALGIVTKNALVTRDLDLLAPLAAQDLVHVFVSVTTLDAPLARAWSRERPRRRRGCERSPNLPPPGCRWG